MAPVSVAGSIGSLKFTVTAVSACALGMPGSGEVMEGATVSEVVESKATRWRPGDVVRSYTGWQAYALAEGSGLERIDPNVAPVSTALGVLGMPGLTAYTGLLNIGQRDVEGLCRPRSQRHATNGPR